MARTTPNLSLHVWNLVSDLFNHTQLAANWDAIDAHDHATNGGAQIPVGGLAPNAVLNSNLDSAAVNTNVIVDSAITTPKLANNVVTSAKILDGSVALSDLATAVLNNFLKINGAPQDLEVKVLMNVAASNNNNGAATLYSANFAHGLGRIPIFGLAQVEQPYTGSGTGAGVFTGRPTLTSTNVVVPLGPLVSGTFTAAAHANLLVIG